MANYFLEDPNNLGKCFNNWNPRDVVFGRETVLNDFITNATITNLTGINIGFTNLSVNNLKWTNATGTNLSVTSLTGSSIFVQNQLNIPSGANGLLLTSDINGNASWQPGKSQNYNIKQISTTTNLTEAQSGNIYELLAGGIPYNVNLPTSSDITGMNYSFIVANNYINGSNPTIVGSSSSIILNQAFVATGPPYNCTTTKVTNIVFGTGASATPGIVGPIGGETMNFVWDGTTWYGQAFLTRASNISAS